MIAPPEKCEKLRKQSIIESYRVESTDWLQHAITTKTATFTPPTPVKMRKKRKKAKRVLFTDEDCNNLAEFLGRNVKGGWDTRHTYATLVST